MYRSTLGAFILRPKRIVSGTTQKTLRPSMFALMEKVASSKFLVEQWYRDAPQGLRSSTNMTSLLFFGSNGTGEAISCLMISTAMFISSLWSVCTVT